MSTSNTSTSTQGPIPLPEGNLKFPSPNDREQFWKKYIDADEKGRQKIVNGKDYIRYVWAGIPHDLRSNLWTTVPSSIPQTQFTPHEISTKLAGEITSVINTMEFLAPNFPTLDSTQKETINTVLRIDAGVFNRDSVVDGAAFLLASMLPVTQTVSSTLQAYQWLCHNLKKFQSVQNRMLNQWAVAVVHVIKKYIPEYFPRLMAAEMDIIDIQTMLTTWVITMGTTVFPASFVYQCIDIVLFDPAGAFGLVGVLLGVLYAVDYSRPQERHTYPFLLLDRIMNLPTAFTEDCVTPSFNWGYALYRSRMNEVDAVAKSVNWRTIVAARDLEGVMLNTPLIGPHLTMSDYPQTEDDLRQLLHQQQLEEQQLKEQAQSTGGGGGKPQPERRRSTFNRQPLTAASASTPSAGTGSTPSSPPASPRQHISLAKASAIRNNLVHLSKAYPSVYPTGYTTLPLTLQSVFQTLIEVDDRISFTVERMKSEQLRAHADTTLSPSVLVRGTGVPGGSGGAGAPAINLVTTVDPLQQQQQGQGLTTEAELSSLLSKLNSTTEALVKYKTINGSNLSVVELSTIEGALSHTKDLVGELHRKSKLITAEISRVSFHSSQYHSFSPAPTSNDGLVKYDDIGYYLQVPCVVMQGYLCKALFQGPKIGSIVRRFYLLQGPFLTEFESHLHKDAYKNRSIDMRGRKIVLKETSPNGFGIEIYAHSDKDKNAILLLVFARSDEERRRWAASLAAVTRLPRHVKDASSSSSSSQSAKV